MKIERNQTRIVYNDNDTSEEIMHQILDLLPERFKWDEPAGEYDDDTVFEFAERVDAECERLNIVLCGPAGIDEHIVFFVDTHFWRTLE